jgi:shikimate dehydrogenase
MPQQKQLFGIIGDPVDHSRSPQMHNAGFKALSINADYQKFPVKENDLPAFLERLKSGEISGINVTIPHKQAVLPLLDSVTDLAKAIGAVNTVWAKEGKLFGDNTDGRGYLQSLIQDTKISLKDKHVVMLGAGGAARAIAFTLCQQGIKKLIILNRSMKNAEELVQSMVAAKIDTACMAMELKDISKAAKNCDLLINTTSKGMEGNTWEDLSFVEDLPKHCIVSDIVYTPLETALLKAAKNHKLTNHSGLGMLIHQGVLAFEHFTGKEVDPKVFEKALKGLKGANQQLNKKGTTTF